MPSTNLSFRTPERLMAQIGQRDMKGVQYPGTVVKRDVERWYAVLADALSEVRLAPAEVVVLVSYAASYDGEPSHASVIDSPLVISRREFAMDDERFDEAQEALGRKMTDWSLAGLYAAWDAAERYEVLARRSADSGLSFGMALHRVGLHTYDLAPEELARIEQIRAVPAEELPAAYLRAVEGEEA